MIQRHYRGEAEKDQYYRIPKMLFLNPRYQPMSIGAKALYGLMLDRMGLSATNQRFMDKDGSIYIYFQQTDAMKMLNVAGKEKIVKLYKELEEAELIERIKQGFGKPDKIYVGKVEIRTEPDALPEMEPETTPEPEFDNRNSETPAPEESFGNRTQEFRFPNPRVSEIETLPNKTELNNLYSINLSDEASATTGTDSGTKVFCREEAENQVAAQIDKQALYEKYPPNKATIDSIAALMVDELTSNRPAATIGGAARTRADVCDRLSAVTTADVAAILDKMKKNPPKMSNPRGYLLTCLYNAPATRISDKPKKDDSELWKYAHELQRRREKKKEQERAQKQMNGNGD